MEQKKNQEKPATCLPTDVIDDWDRRLRVAGCSEEQRSALRRVIESTLPYPSRACVETCVAGYTASCYETSATEPDEALVSSVLTQLELAGQLEATGRYAQSHPVAEGIKRIINEANKLKVTPAPSLSFFIGLCQQALHHPERLTPGTYYQHVYYVRDVLRFMLRAQVAGALPNDQSVAQACSHLRQWFDPEEKTNVSTPIPTLGFRNPEDKTEITNKLIDGTLSLGVPSRTHNREDQEQTTENASDETQPTQRKSPPSTIPLPAYLAPEPGELKTPRPRKKVPKRESLAYAWDEGGEEMPQAPQPAPGPSVGPAGPEARVDSEVIGPVKIDAPPEFSPSERRKRYASLLNVHAAQNTASRSDMQRFSRRQMSTWLEQVAEKEPLTGCFLLLIWTLGMTPDRLGALRVGTHPPTGNEDIVLNPITHRLTYRIRHMGATPETSDEADSTCMPENHVLQLALPAGIVELIVTTGTPQPFLDMERRYSAQRKRVEKASDSHGPSTLKQWAASTASFQAERFNALESATLRGDMRFHEVASSAYRAHEMATLNQKFADCLAALRAYWDAESLMTGPGLEPFANLAVTGVYPEGILGSVRYAPPESLIPAVHAIRNAVKQIHQRLNAPYKRKSLSDLLTLINLQQLNYFLVLQLHTVGRPLNNKTTIGISPQGLWVSDKASHRYRERKLICSISAEDVEKSRGLLLAQRQNCRHAQHQLADVAHPLGLAVQLAEPAVIDLPCEVRYLPAKRAIEVARMTPARWQRVIDELGLNQKWTTAANVIRHLASTELSQSLSDAVVDEALGHKHPGKDWWGSESSGTWPELAVMAPAIENWAQRMELRVVALNDRVFGGFYAVP